MSRGFFFWQSLSLDKLELYAMASKPAPSIHELPLQWNQAPVTPICHWKNKVGRGGGKWVIQRLNEESPPRNAVPRTWSLLKHQRTRRLRKRHSKKWICAASNFTLIPPRSIRQMLPIFSGVEFLKTASKIRWKKTNLLSCVHFFTFPTKGIFAWPFSRRRSRAATVKKCTKKRDVRAESLFC